MYIALGTMPFLNIADAIHCNTHAQINNMGTWHHSHRVDQETK
jgi:hypothetical protein